VIKIVPRFPFPDGTFRTENELQLQWKMSFCLWRFFNGERQTVLLEKAEEIAVVVGENEALGIFAGPWADCRSDVDVIEKFLI
jgi:hypothetical protein